MKAKRIVMAVAVLVIVLAMACALVSCDLFVGIDDKDTTYEVTLECDSSKGSVSGGGKFKQGDSVRRLLIFRLVQWRKQGIRSSRMDF